MFFAQGLPLPENRVECTSILTLRNLLLTDDAIAALPMLIAEEDDRLVALPTPLQGVRRLVGATVAKSRTPGPSSSLFLHHLWQAAVEIRERLAPHDNGMHEQGMGHRRIGSEPGIACGDEHRARQLLPSQVRPPSRKGR